MDNTTEFVVVLSTAPPGSAAPIAKSLIEKRLVACVNIVPVSSHFRWEGGVQVEAEELMIAKTRRVLVPAVTDEIRRLHTYELPEIVAIPVTGGSVPYLEWVGRETAV